MWVIKEFTHRRPFLFILSHMGTQNVAPIIHIMKYNFIILPRLPRKLSTKRIFSSKTHELNNFEVDVSWNILPEKKSFIQIMGAHYYNNMLVSLVFESVIFWTDKIFV